MSSYQQIAVKQIVLINLATQHIHNVFDTLYLNYPHLPSYCAPVPPPPAHYHLSPLVLAPFRQVSPRCVAIEYDSQFCPMIVPWLPPVNHLRSAEKNREIKGPWQLMSGGNHKTNQCPATGFYYPAAPLGSQGAGCSEFEFGWLAVA